MVDIMISVKVRKKVTDYLDILQALIYYAHEANRLEKKYIILWWLVDNSRSLARLDRTKGKLAIFVFRVARYLLSMFLSSLLSLCLCATLRSMPGLISLVCSLP